jgi:hypothetical protein
MRAEIDEIGAVGKMVGHELSRRVRQQYLTAMSDPSRADRTGSPLRRSSCLVAQLCVASVQRHPPRTRSSLSQLR